MEYLSEFLLTLSPLIRLKYSYRLNEYALLCKQVHFPLFRTVVSAITTLFVTVKFSLMMLSIFVSFSVLPFIIPYFFHIQCPLFSVLQHLRGYQPVQSAHQQVIDHQIAEQDATVDHAVQQRREL